MVGLGKCVKAQTRPWEQVMMDVNDLILDRGQRPYHYLLEHTSCLTRGIEVDRLGAQLSRRSVSGCGVSTAYCTCLHPRLLCYARTTHHYGQRCRSLQQCSGDAHDDKAHSTKTRVRVISGCWLPRLAAAADWGTGAARGSIVQGSIWFLAVRATGKLSLPHSG